MSIYSLERKYTLFFIVLTVLFSSIIGQLPYVSFLLNTFLLLAGLFFFGYKTTQNYTFPKSNKIILCFMGGLLTISLGHYITFADIKFFLLTSLQLFILGSGYKYENRDLLLKNIRFYLKVFIYIVSFLSSLSLLLYYMGIQFSYGKLMYIRFFDGVFDGLYLNPNTIGYISFMALAFIWLLKISGKINWKLWFCFCVNIACLLLCKSRTSLGASFIFLFFYKMLQTSPIKQRILFIILLFVVVGMVVYGDVILSFAGTLFNKAQDDSLNGRGLLWMEGLAALDDYYLWGTGYGNFSNIILSRNPDLELAGFLGGGLHNFYLQTAVIFGVIILAFFLVLLGSVFKVKLKRSDTPIYNLLTGMKAFIAAVCFIAFFEVHMLYAANVLNTFFWIFIGILLLTKSKNGEAIIYRHSLL